jgi:hypothetical protein
MRVNTTVTPVSASSPTKEPLAPKLRTTLPRVWIALLALVSILCVCVVLFVASYPGLAKGLVRQARYSTWHENRNLGFLISYWLTFMQKLRLDPVSGNYNFSYRPPDGLSAFEQGRLAYHRGVFTEAVTDIEADIRDTGESEKKLFWLAASYMRLAEAVNCLQSLRGQENHAHMDMPAGMACILPVTVFQRKTEGSLAAARTFERLLDRYDPQNRLYQWLLNFSYMTINRFPEGVPAKYRINTPFIDAFYGTGKKRAEAEYADLNFVDEAKELGVDMFSPGRGVAVEDFDGDGYLDIVAGGTYGPIRFYHNDHGRRFVEVTRQVGLENVGQIFAITPADYDNDGWVDLFIGRPFTHYLLFHNNGDGTFTDVTQQSGLLDPKQAAQIAVTWIPSWADVNNDGKLDLFLAQWAFKMPFLSGVMAKPRMDSVLLINENGRFVDRTREYGLGALVKDYYYIGSTFGDYDNDGYPDLFLSSPLRKSSVLLHNVRGKRFEITDLVNRAASGFAAAFLDINHDGRLDIFQAGFGDAKSAVEQSVFGENTGVFQSGHSAILLQTPDGQFEEHEEGFDMPMSTMGSSFGDLNNDGCYDFYLGTGDPEGWFVLPHLMYMGRTNGTTCTLEMRNVSMLQGFGTVQKGHGIVFADFDDDGRQDIFSALGGMWPGDAWPSQLFMNKSRIQNTWTKIRLRGRRTNRFGLGARIKVVAENAKDQEIVRYYSMDNKTGFGSGPFVAQIGLMDAIRIKRTEVFWPATHCTQPYVVELRKLNVLDEAPCLEPR